MTASPTAERPWQDELADWIATRLPDGSSVERVGSVTESASIDGWSDLDLHLELTGNLAAEELVGDPLWAFEVAGGGAEQVLRTVLTDGRRIDLVVTGRPLLVPTAAPDNDVRFLAAQATTRLGRGDRLIGYHLLLELWQHCLVQAMLLRDRDLGTSIHRAGSASDAARSAEIGRLAAALTLEIADAPPGLPMRCGPAGATSPGGVVEQTVELYARWRRELEPAYRPDWSGLTALLRRGRAGAGRAGAG